MDYGVAATKFVAEIGKFEAKRSGDDIILEFDPY